MWMDSDNNNNNNNVYIVLFAIVCKCMLHIVGDVDGVCIGKKGLNIFLRARQMLLFPLLFSTFLFFALPK